MRHIFCSKPGEAYFSTSDIGWVVGHSYIVYGPLINGSTTIMYEGVPMRPDAGIWWKIVHDYKVTSMFTSPTAIRVLKKQDPAYMRKYDIGTLKYLFLAGEPLDEPTARWVAESLSHVAIVDNYWQTETGWPILTACPGVEDTPRKFGSPVLCGLWLPRQAQARGDRQGSRHRREGRALPRAAVAAGRDDHDLGRRRALRADLLHLVQGRAGLHDVRLGDARRDGYYFVLGRTDDVINVAAIASARARSRRRYRRTPTSPRWRWSA
jgi:propionyl-CoA synthetase